MGIAALERHLERGGERSPEVLLALAMLTYEDAATLVLNRLTQASKTALALLDEALEGQPEPSAPLRALRARFARALDRERARERRLRELADRPERARPIELIELANRILLSGEDDELATELMVEAGET